jgi:Caspase domain
MPRIRRLQGWLLAVVGWAAVFGWPASAATVEVDPTSRAQVRVMVIFKDAAGRSSNTIEIALTRVFQSHGYAVLDPASVAQTLRVDADLLQLHETEAAKRLGARAGADIVVSGSARVSVQERAPSILGGKRLIVGQADVGAKAILVRSGKVLAAETAHPRKPFDTTGELALEAAAEELAGKLFEGIGRFLSSETIDYRLVILNITPAQSMTVQEGVRRKVKGVRQVNERGFTQNTLDLDVSIEKKEDVAFKRSIFTQLSELGLGSFEVEAREGETIYLRRVDQGSRVGRPEPEPKEPSPGPPGAPTYKPGYRKSWAVVIGINEYQRWPKLRFAVNDAQSIQKLLKRLGFDEVTAVLDGEATQQNILRVLGDELYDKTQEDDRVFIFYAGHGQTQDLPNGSKMGYIIPADGDLKHYYSTAISMRQLQDLSDRIRAKHIFYAMDTCFSGLLLRLRGEAKDESFIAQTSAPARQVLTAGGEGEQVAEVGGHGLFTSALLAGLEGAADLNRDGRITASEIYQFITPHVLEKSRNSQNPLFGRLGRGPGEFVFVFMR